MEERNCAFQYAEMETGILRNTNIVCDKTGLTLDEAKELWNNYNQCKQLPCVTMNGDNLCVIPGTIQANFEPYIIK